MLTPAILPALDSAYIVERLAELCRIPSPTGFSAAAIDYCERIFGEQLSLAVRRTRKGALIVTLPGKDTERHRTLSAHVDTLGAMVKEIRKNGRLRLTQLGGYAWSTIEGEYCLVHTSAGKAISGTILLEKASSHVHGQETNKTERNAETLEVRLDEKISSPEETRALGIQVGDFVSLDARTTVTENGFIKSRHLDDKSAVAILFGVAKAIVDAKQQLAVTTHFFISNYEEVGHGAAAGIPPQTDEFIAVDMAAIGTGQTSDEYSVTICAKDSSGPYDYELTHRLQDLAERDELNYKVDIYPYYGSDASAALRSGGEFRAALVGPGIDASHSFERTHVSSLEETAKLLLAYLVV